MEQYMDLPLYQARNEWEKIYLQYQVDKHGGNITQTAKTIGMDRTSLHRKMRELETRQ